MLKVRVNDFYDSVQHNTAQARLKGQDDSPERMKNLTMNQYENYYKKLRDEAQKAREIAMKSLANMLTIYAEVNCPELQLVFSARENLKNTWEIVLYSHAKKFKEEDMENWREVIQTYGEKLGYL